MTVEATIQDLAKAVTARHTVIATELAARLDSLPLAKRIEELAVVLATEFRYGVNYATDYWAKNTDESIS